MTTKAHNLYRYLTEKYGFDKRDMDLFVIHFYNLSDEEFDKAIQDPVYDHEDSGLHAEWD